MPKMKTHKGMKKRFTVSATGKVRHKRCGSSHLMSHKSGKRVRRLRKKAMITNTAEARRLRLALQERVNVNPNDVKAHKLAFVAHQAELGQLEHGEHSHGHAEHSQPGEPSPTESQ